MGIGDQGKFDQGDQKAGKQQGNQGDQEEPLFLRVAAEGNGPFSGGAKPNYADGFKFEQTQAQPGARTRPDAQPDARTRPDAQPEVRTRPDAQMQAGQGREREVRGPNGSKIQLSSNYPDGQERPVAVTEPDGLKHRYLWKEVNGKVICIATEDLSPQGQPLARGLLMQQGQNTWKFKAGNGPEFPLQGTLTVDANGVHRFREPNGNTFTRNPDGSANYTDSSGRSQPHPLARGPKEFVPNPGVRLKR